jgi:subtilisin family serine protease
MKKSWFLLVVLFGLLVVLQAQEQRNANAANPSQSVPGELLVQLKSGATSADLGRALGRINAEFLETVAPEARRRDGHGDLVLIRHQPDFTPEVARRILSSDAAVEFAEQNWIYTHQQTASNDPYYTGGALWGMYGAGTTPGNQFGSQAGAAWAKGNTGSGTVLVGVIDEGIQWQHQDLAANIWSNPYDAPGDRIDNDGNGYVDDVRGWDFDRNDNTTYDGTADDHGTHVAGTIGAVGGNGLGVAGVVWNVKIITAKFLGSRGGTTANAIKAIDYFTDLKTRHGLNIVATNNSWGGGGYSSSLQAAIERANTANILFVAAAGNGGSDGVGDNNDTTPSYPASYPNANIISVAAITSSGTRSSFSNYGATSVDIGAPGSSINSTLPSSTRNKYGAYSGTSMATPHVTGAVALYASLNPGATAASIKYSILSSAVSTPALVGKTVSGGRLNVSGF